MNRLNDAMLRVIGPLAMTIAVWWLFRDMAQANPQDPGLIEIIKNLAVLSAGFWLGSSSGSKGSAQVPGVNAPATPPQQPQQAPAPVVVQTGSPANAEAAQPRPQAAQARVRTGPPADLIQGLE